MAPRISISVTKSSALPTKAHAQHQARMHEIAAARMTPAGVPDAAAVWLPLDALTPWADNPRQNDGLPVDKVAESIRHFGFVTPIVVWAAQKRMVAGHTRLKAMRQLMADEPDFTPRGAPGPGLARVLFYDFADEAEADQYAIADNRLGELATWDDEGLGAILARFNDEERSLVGFDDEAGEEEPEVGDGDLDDAPPLPVVPVTQPGDLWVLGNHRLLCGDATKAADVARLVGGQTIDMLWTDPPYNVEIVGGNHGIPAAERKKNGALTIQNDSMSDEAFRAFLVAAFKAADAVMRCGATLYIAHADSEGFNFRGAARDVGWKQAQCLIWVKNSLVMGRQDYHWRHEPILYGWKLGAGHHMLTDRKQDTVWEIDRPQRSTEHPTMKPVALVERAIMNSTNKGERVLDLFGGSGTTLIASASAGRVAYLLELDPRYCDVVVARWEKATGKKAERSAS